VIWEGRSRGVPRREIGASFTDDEDETGKTEEAVFLLRGGAIISKRKTERLRACVNGEIVAVVVADVKVSRLPEIVCGLFR
jgi:hypothetical protein